MLWLVIIILALVLLCFGVLCGLYRFVFRSPRKGQNDPHAMLSGEQYDALAEEMESLVCRIEAEPFEAVSITAFDGTKLYGRLYLRREGAPISICMHGYRGTAYRDFSGGSLLALRSGQNVLLPDERAHGKSAGHTITFGDREQRDLLSWAEYLNRRFGKEIPLYFCGISMGASTVLLASGADTPENLRGIVADCPYDSAKSIICDILGRMHLPKKLFYPLIAFSGRLFGGVNLKNTDASKAVRHSKVPILILHGEDDRFVPAFMSEAIARENPEKIRRVTFPKAGHGLSYLVDPPRYEKAYAEFLVSTGFSPQR